MVDEIFRGPPLGVIVLPVQVDEAALHRGRHPHHRGRVAEVRGRALPDRAPLHPRVVRVDLKARLLLQLPQARRERVLSGVHRPAREVPGAGLGHLLGAEQHQHPLAGREQHPRARTAPVPVAPEGARAGTREGGGDREGADRAEGEGKTGAHRGELTGWRWTREPDSPPFVVGRPVNGPARNPKRETTHSPGRALLPRGDRAAPSPLKACRAESLRAPLRAAPPGGGGRAARSRSDSRGPVPVCPWPRPRSQRSGTRRSGTPTPRGLLAC